MLFHVHLTGAIGHEFFGSKDILIDKHYLRRLRNYAEDAIEGKYGLRASLSFSETFDLRPLHSPLPVPLDHLKRYLIGVVEDYVTRHPVNHAS